MCHSSYLWLVLISYAAHIIILSAVSAESALWNTMLMPGAAVRMTWKIACRIHGLLRVLCFQSNTRTGDIEPHRTPSKIRCSYKTASVCAVLLLMAILVFMINVARVSSFSLVFSYFIAEANSESNLTNDYVFTRRRKLIGTPSGLPIFATSFRCQKYIWEM
jgi:hypothetical protein